MFAERNSFIGTTRPRDISSQRGSVIGFLIRDIAAAMSLSFVEARNGVKYFSQFVMISNEL